LNSGLTGSVAFRDSASVSNVCTLHGCEQRLRRVDPQNVVAFRIRPELVAVCRWARSEAM
jgi:hypothetical protein